MTISDIYKALYRHYVNYEYKLQNTFVYNWESDFFAQSKSGYFVEVEVKMSRSDFFVDFKKEKHRLFKDVMAGKSHHVYNTSTQRVEVGKYKVGELITQYGLDSRWVEPWARGIVNGKLGYWANDYGRTYIQHKSKYIYSDTCRIKVRAIEYIHCPHQFYFACPEGLIKPNEIPPYAGLLYVDDNGIFVEKKAPYLHKRKQDLTIPLLSKFYNLWKFKVDYDEKQNLFNQQKK